jgi:enediyne biosynthesis protein E5
VKAPSFKMQLAGFLAVFAAYLSWTFQEISFLFALLIAVGSALCFDAGAVFLKTKKIKLSESALISGLIIGYVLSSAQPWWIFSVAAFFAIASKQFLCWNRKHLLNPAAFGILLTVLIFKAFIAWNGADLWYALVPFGIYFAWKARKLEMVGVYVLVGGLLSGAEALLKGEPLGLSFLGYQNFFFIFIMLIEPKTTPIRRMGKALFGAGVAAGVFLLIAMGIPMRAELYSLLAFNLMVPLLNKLPIEEGSHNKKEDNEKNNRAVRCSGADGSRNGFARVRGEEG